MSTALFWLLVVGVVLVGLGIAQVARHGGIDANKVKDVASEDVSVATKAGSSFVAALKKLFHKG